MRTVIPSTVSRSWLLTSDTLWSRPSLPNTTVARADNEARRVAEVGVQEHFAGMEGQTW